jgi:hypothetical protein
MRLPHPLKTRPFAFALIAAIVLSLVGGLRTPIPADGAPAYALQASIVYRIEVALAVFVALYLAAVTLRLAWYGRTFTRVGASGAEIPDVRLIQAGVDHARQAERLIQEIQAELADLQQLESRLSITEERLRHLDGGGRDAGGALRKGS